MKSNREMNLLSYRPIFINANPHVSKDYKKYPRILCQFFHLLNLFITHRYIYIWYYLLNNIKRQGKRLLKPSKTCLQRISAHRLAI